MPSPTVDYILGDALMHSHGAGDITDLTTTLDPRYVNITGDTMGGNLIFPDNNSVLLGTGSDGGLYHDGTNTYFQNNTGNIIIENDASDGDITFKVNDGGVDTTVMTIDGATGNVGIGTTSPLTPFVVTATNASFGSNNVDVTNNGVFSVYGANNTSYAGGYPMNMQLLDSAAMAQDVGGGIVFGGNDGTFPDRWWSGFHGGKENGTSGNYAGYLSFHTRVNGGALTEKLRISSGGNVGIGTTSPGYALQVGMTPDLAVDSINHRVHIGAEYSNIPLSVYGANNSDYAGGYPMNMALIDSAASAQDVGGGIVFGGNDGGGTTTRWFAGFHGGKENATPGDYAGYLSFHTRVNGGAATEKMRITSTGNVGIGTTSPNYTLEVYGTASTTNLLVTNLTTISATSTTLYVSGTTTLAATSGRVGIGTTNPGAKLDVNSFNGTYDQISAIFHAGENWTGGFNRIQMRSGTGDGVVKTEFTDVIGVAGAGADLRFRVADASDVLQDRLAIQAGGNVGIGTTAPNNKLTVLGNIDIPSGNYFGWWSGGAVSGYLQQTSNKIVFNNIQDSGYEFDTAGIGPAVRILDNGNVGIGTTTPINSLGFGTGSTGIGFYSSNPVLNSGKIAEIVQSEVGSGNGHLLFKTYQGGSGGAERMRIQNDGNVGIGTTSPTNILSVGGNSARTFWLERHTTANTAGNTLTITAGGATSGATDKTGGALILQGGLSTGSAESGVTIQGCVAGATGTTDRTQTTMIQVLGSKIGFYTQTPIARAVLATGASHTVDDVITALQNLGLVSQS